MTDPIRILVVGAGHMGRSHSLAYQKIPGFEIAGLCTRSPESRGKLNAELGGGYPEFGDYYEALKETKPDAVSINTYTATHAPYAMAALEAGCHIFIEKPLAETVAEAEQIVDKVKETGRKMVIGYILRVHPSWQRFIEITHTLGKPLVMRMNLNQQACGEMWQTHKNLMASCPPIVDCGVHYVDIMCQMTRSRPVRVSGIGARLTDDLPDGMFNYGQLQVTFEDGSVGWYEAGWGPMMSEVAFFVKDVVGPNGCVSIVADKAGEQGQSSNVEAHTQTQALRVHHAELSDDESCFTREDEVIRLDDEPDHEELCVREQQLFLDAIQKNVDMSGHLDDAIQSMRITAAAVESFRTGKTIEL